MKPFEKNLASQGDDYTAECLLHYSCLKKLQDDCNRSEQTKATQC